MRERAGWFFFLGAEVIILNVAILCVSPRYHNVTVHTVWLIAGGAFLCAIGIALRMGAE